MNGSNTLPEAYMDGLSADILLRDKRRAIFEFLVRTDKYVLSAAEIAAGTLNHYTSKTVDNNNGVSCAEKYAVIYRPPKPMDKAKASAADVETPERWAVPITAVTRWLDGINYSFPDPPSNELAAEIVDYLNRRIDVGEETDALAALFAAHCSRIVDTTVTDATIKYLGDPEATDFAAAYPTFPFLDQIEEEITGWEHKYDEYVLAVTIETEDLALTPTDEELLETALDGLVATVLTTVRYNWWANSAAHATAFSRHRAAVTERAEGSGDWRNTLELNVDVDEAANTVTINSYQRRWEA
jgi:hypothetical protein